MLNIYNAAFDALGLNWRCVPLSVQAGQLREALLGLRALGFVGAEVAQTYQRDVLSHLENLSTAAETTGVVDLVWVDQSGQLIGDNVHWLGFLTALRAMVPSLNGLRPLIIGAGDAAGSIVYALTRQGLPLTIIDGQMHRAVDLVHRLRHVLNEHSFSVYRWPQDLKRVASNVNLIINATGIGAWPDAVRSPWPDDLPFPPNALAVDLVSWPSDTRFLRQARDSGARTVNGLSLMVCTAAMAFEKWTGHLPPIEAMRLVAGKAMVPQTPQGLLRHEDESLSQLYKSLPELT